jgi:hypothetical protein
MGQCAAYKPDGERCQRSAEGQHGLCWAHDPANAGRRKQVAAKGGRARANRERQWIKDELLRIAHKVETDESFDPTRANSAIRALAAASEISRSLEENDIASEFENLKSVLREHGVYIG